MNSVVSSNALADTRLIVVMGVSGSGKTSLAMTLAEHYAYRFLDADNFHSESARARMTRGQPLTDEMRAPWVESLQNHLRIEAEQQQHCVLAFSGLKHLHRNKIREAGLKTLFLFLCGDKLTIQDRLHKRTNHFMSPELLDSQFDSLEEPTAETDIIRLDITHPLDNVVAQAIAAIAEIPDW
jgi:gluconokinase